MTERTITEVAQNDIAFPSPVQPGDSIVVLERHERYVVDSGADNAGSLYPEHASAAFARDQDHFQNVFSGDQAARTMVLFLASDTQYAGKGYRAMETVQVAQNAAASVLQQAGLRPEEHIINLRDDTRMSRFQPNAIDGAISIRPEPKLREPQIFGNAAYVGYLLSKYGSAEGDPARLSQPAWAAHEADVEREMREACGAEGVYDIVDRTKRCLRLLHNYAARFQTRHPESSLIFWAGSHYDTISPLVKQAAGISFDQFLPVAYGGGVMVRLDQEGHTLTVQGQELPLPLG